MGRASAKELATGQETGKRRDIKGFLKELQLEQHFFSIPESDANLFPKSVKRTAFFRESSGARESWSMASENCSEGLG